MLPSAKDVEFLDEPAPNLVSSRTGRGLTLVYTARHGGDAAADLRLADWTEDDWIEYLLGCHPDQCADVLTRLRASADSELLALPDVCTVVIDRMARDSGCQDVAAALLGEVAERLDPRHARILRHICVQRAKLGGADLRGASLCDADLRHANLSMVRLADVDLRGTDLRGATLGGLKLRLARLDGARLATADLCRADLEGMDLEGADFHGALLRAALLTGSHLPNADFAGADLRDAGLAEVSWRGVNLAGANLSGATFHLGSSRSGKVDSSIASEGTRTGFYTDEYFEQAFRAPGEIRKADLREVDLRGAVIDDVDFYLVDLRGAHYDAAQLVHLRRTRAIL